MTNSRDARSDEDSRRSRFRRYAVATLTVVASSSLYAQPASIRALVVYSNDARQAITTEQQYAGFDNNIETHASANIAIVNQILVNSGLSSVVQVVLADVADNLVYDENDPSQGNDHLATVATQINENSATIAADGKTIDELRHETMADLVFVVAKTATFCCGGSSGVLRNSAGEHENFVAAVHPSNTQTVIDDDWAHELGHLAGALHPNSTIVDPIDPNAKGYVHPNAVFGTVMSQFSDCSDRIGGNGCKRAGVFSSTTGTVVVNGTSYTPGDSQHNVVGLLQQTLPQLAQYAEEAAQAAGGAPPTPAAVAEFLGCSGNTSQFSVTWWPGSGGGPTGIFEVQRLIGSVWYPYHEDVDDLCVAWGTSSNTHFRIRGVNAYAASAWYNFLANAQCGGGGEPD